MRERVITLSPNQQNLLNLTEQTSANLLGTAVDRSAFLNDYLRQGLDTSSLTPWSPAASAPTLSTDPTRYQQLQGYGGPQQGIASGFGAFAPGGATTTGQQGGGTGGGFASSGGYQDAPQPQAASAQPAPPQPIDQYQPPEDAGDIARLYDQYFDRAPDQSGLDFWQGNYDAGMSLEDIGQRFANSQERQDYLQEQDALRQRQMLGPSPGQLPASVQDLPAPTLSPTQLASNANVHPTYNYVGAPDPLVRDLPLGGVNLAQNLDLNQDLDLGNVSVRGGGGSGGTNIGLRNAANTFDVNDLNLQQASGRVPGAGQGIQGGVNLTTEGGRIDPLQNTFEVERVSGNIAPSGDITQVNEAGLGNLIGSIQNDTWDIDRALPDYRNYEDQRSRVEDAIMSRYNRQFADSQNALDQRLRNQGLEPGSEAYDRQFRQLREQQNDAIMQSILAGGQEQSRLAALDQAAAQYGLAAQGQGFDQAQARGLFGLNIAGLNNAAQQQQFSQNLAQTQMDITAALQNAQLEEARARFGNEAQAQMYMQTLGNNQAANQARLAMGQFANAAQDQRVAQLANQTALGINAANINNQAQLSRGNLFNQGAGIQNQYTLGVGGLQNQAASIANQYAAQMAGLDLEAQIANNQAALAEAQFNNDATLAQAGFNNQAQLAQAGFNNDALLQGAGFYNNAISQGLNNNLAAAGFNNATGQQAFQNTGTLANYYNDAQQRAFDQGLSLAGFNNAVTQQNNANAAAQQAAYNQALMQQYGLNQGASDAANALRQAQLQEQAYLRGLPISEINSLMSGSELLMPSFTPQFQTGVAPVPIGNYMQDAYQNQLNASTATAQGLLGLGSAVLPVLLGSDRRIKKDIQRIGALASGIPVYSYRLRYNDKPEIGVMADEVRHIQGAVHTIGGIDHVDYQKVLNHGG